MSTTMTPAKATETQSSGRFPFGKIPFWDRTNRRLPRWVLVAGAFGVAWLLPVLTNLAHVNVLLIPLIVVGVASLLRVGSGLVDRLMFAIALTAGLALVAGFLFTYWPWGFHPVAVGGFAFTALIVFALLTRRDPSLPLTFSGSDLVLVGGGVIAGLIACLPLLRVADGSWWISYVMINGDRVRHYGLFDTIQAIGGYPFLKVDEAASIIGPSTSIAYPPGAHYLYSLIDTFVAGTGDADPLSELHRYGWYVAFGYAFFVVAVAWAARWIAGTALAGWRSVFVVAALTLFLATGIYTTNIWETFDSQVVSMAFLALLVAVLARPPQSVGEQIILIGSLTLGVTISYTLYGVFAVIGVLAALVVFRQRFLRNWRMSLVGFCVFTPLIAAQVVVPKIFYEFDGVGHLNVDAFIVPMPRLLLFGLLVLAVFGAVALAGEFVGTAKVLATVLIGGALVLVAVFVENTITVGKPIYYFEKAVYGYGVILLVASGAALLWVKESIRKTTPAGKSIYPWWKRTVFGALAVVAAAAVTASIPWGPIGFNYSIGQRNDGTSWGRVWANGQQIYSANSEMIGFLAREGVVGSSRPTIIVSSDEGLTNFDISSIVAVLNQDYGPIELTLGGPFQGIGPLQGLVSLPLEGPLSTDTQAHVDRFCELIRDNGDIDLQVITKGERFARELTTCAERNPNLGLTVRYMPSLPIRSSPPREW